MGAARRLVPAPRGPASSWFRRGRSADLPRYYAKHSKTDRLDSQLLAGLPMLHADGPQLIMKALNVGRFPVAISPVLGEDTQGPERAR
jgi:hypothetical protein